MNLRWKPTRIGSDRTRTLLWLGAAACVVLLSFLYARREIMLQAPYGAYRTPDEANYLAMAQRLLETHTYSYWGRGPDAYVSPGYPLFLTACMALFGWDLNGILCIKLVQCVLVAATVGLTFLLGWLLTEKYSVGLIAAILLALNGHLTYFARRMLTENFYFFTMMLFFVLLALALKKDRLWLHLVAGVAFAVTVLVRPLVLVAAPFAYLPLILARWRQWKKLLSPLLCFAAGFLAVCLPWWIRNLVVLHQFIPLASQTNPIYAGLAPDVAALGIKNPRSLLGNLRLLLHLLATDFKRTVYWFTFQKFEIIFLEPVTRCHYPPITNLARNITLYLGLCGGVRALFSRRGWGPALTFFVYLAASFLFVPTQRYSLQYMPLLAVLAGWLLVHLFGRSRPAPAEAKPA